MAFSLELSAEWSEHWPTVVCFFLQEWNCFTPVLLPSSWCRAEAFLSRLLTKVGNGCQQDLYFFYFFIIHHNLPALDKTHILHMPILLHPPLHPMFPALLSLFSSSQKLLFVLLCNCLQPPSPYLHSYTSKMFFQPFFKHPLPLSHIHVCTSSYCMWHWHTHASLFSFKLFVSHYGAPGHTHYNI